MSPSKQKLNERQAGIQDRKASARQAASGGLSANAYNPSSGTFHTLEALNPDTESGYINGRFKSIDENDDTASSHGGGADLDCMSNNGSCSGESEDQLQTSAKDKIAKSGEKRDKIRNKNERKHQRQKERRAQELKDKCNGYLMSRKLEGLSQKLVSMGFSQERATMSLIINDGHVEQSVAWLLEGGEGQVHEDWCPSGNLKIDISEELGQLLEIEKKYKFSRPDLERAVVSSEGDLEKARDLLRAHSVAPNSEEDFKVESRRSNAEQPVSDSPIACQQRSNAAIQPPHQSRKPVIAAQSFEGRQHDDSCAPVEGSLKGSSQIQPTKPQTLSGVERRVLALPQSSPVKTPPLVPSFMSVSSADTGLVFGFDAPDPRLLFASSMKDHFMNAPVKESAHKGRGLLPSQMSHQPIMAPSSVPASTPSLSPSCWTHKGLMEVGSPSSVLHVHDDMTMQGLAFMKHSVKGFEVGPRDLSDRISSLIAMQAELQVSGLGSRLPYDIAAASSSSTPTTHSGSPSGTSYGLFTGWGGGVSQSSVDWSTGPLRNCDYRNIDWSMNATPTASSQLSFLTAQMKSSYYGDFEGDRRVKSGRRAADLSNGGVSGAGMQDNTSRDLRNSSREWTSPFAGKALVNFPQAVSSPYL